MTHSSPELHHARALEPAGDSVARWGLFAGVAGVGVGMGMALTGAVVPGSCVAGAALLLFIAALLIRRKYGPPALLDGPALPTGPDYVDAESRLPNTRYLTELLNREIARSVRYGDRSAIALFDVRPAGYQKPAEGEDTPSPSQYVAKCLLDSARSSDIVGRLDETHFIVVLSESDAEGADTFTERTRTKLGTVPFARTANGTGIYVRAWAGAAHWEPSITTTSEYLQAANDVLERTRTGYESEQSWYRGERGD